MTEYKDVYGRSIFRRERVGNVSLKFEVGHREMTADFDTGIVLLLALGRRYRFSCLTLLLVASYHYSYDSCLQLAMFVSWTPDS